MTTRHFTFVEGTSSKFWEVTVEGSQLTIRFGRIGASGQTQLKSFGSPSEAQEEADALISSKTKKGYVEGEGATAAPSASAPAAAPKKAAKPGKAPKPEAVDKAFYKRDYAKVKSFIEAGADVNFRYGGQRTLLHRAADAEELELLELLIARGAEVDARDDEKLTPYMVTGSPQIRAALRKAGSKGLDEANGHALKPKTKKCKVAAAEVDGSALGVDAKGDLWFAGHEGIHRWDGKALTLYVFEESFSVDRVLPGARGLLYFSTNWGIVTFDGKAWRLVSCADSELHDQHITDFAVDRNGVAYALGYGGEATVDRPISRYDGKSVTVLMPGVDFPKGIEAKNVTFDAKNQMLFFGAVGVRFPDGKKFSPGGNEVDRVILDGNTLWADCGYMGLYRRVGTSTKKFSLDDGVEALVLSGKTMWIGNGGGLHRIDGDKLTKVEGAFSDGIDGLALGKNGTLWVSSSGKIFSFSKGEARSLDGKVVEPQSDDAEDEE